MIIYFLIITIGFIWPIFTDQAGMVEKTITQMRLGGIFDQIGYGFHRYSTDELWRVPHFEIDE